MLETEASSVKKWNHRILLLSSLTRAHWMQTKNLRNSFSLRQFTEWIYVIHLVWNSSSSLKFQTFLTILCYLHQVKLHYGIFKMAFDTPWPPSSLKVLLGKFFFPSLGFLGQDFCWVLLLKLLCACKSPGDFAKTHIVIQWWWVLRF